MKAILGLAVLGGFGWFVYQAKQGQGLPFEVPGMVAAKPVELRKGTEIELLLLTPLTSGGSEVGDPVKCVVAKDVTAGDGRVLVAEGTVVEGKVVRSRGGTLAGSLTNQPARLEVEIGEVQTVDGKKVALQGKGESGRHSFTQANTKGGGNVVDLAQDPEAQAFLRSAVERMAKGETLPPAEQKQADAELARLAERYDLESTKRLLKGDKGPERSSGAQGVLDALQKGDFGGLAGHEVVLGVQALEEIANLGAGLDKSLRGAVKGSNVKAQVGTRVTATTAKAVTVRPR